MADAEGTYEISSKVRGYHQYQSIWNALDGEELPCRVELSNRHDLFAVAVCKLDIVVGHVPKRISSICSSFLRRGGTILCKVTGSRQYSADLPQGGLEIPCTLIFAGISRDIEKVKKLIKFVTGDGELPVSITTTESPSSSITVAESSSTAIKVAQSPCLSIKVAESPGSSIKVAQSSSTAVDVAQSPESLIKVSQSPGSLINIAQSSSIVIAVTKSPSTIVQVPSSSNEVAESSISSVPISKPASSFNVVNSPITVIDADAYITPGSESSTAIKTENTQLLGSHCKRSSSQTDRPGKRGKRVMPNDEELGRIIRGDDLTDYSINCACKILKQQFTKVKGLHLTLYQRKKHSETFLKDHIEIIHSRNDHWIVATTMMCKDEVVVYDSAFNSLDDDTLGIVHNLFCCTSVKMAACQKQEQGTNDCGLFSIANATALVNGIEPTKLRHIQGEMRMHLVQCFRQGMLTIFPCTFI